MCVLFFLKLLSETFLILRRIPRDKNLRRSSCRQPVILPGFNKNLIFLTYFRKIHEYQFPWKIFQRDTSCSTRTDGRTDIPKLLAAFRNFVNAPRNIYPYHTPYADRDNTVGVATSFVQSSVSQNVVLGFCPCGPFRLNISTKKTEIIKLTWIAYHTL